MKEKELKAISDMQAAIDRLYKSTLRELAKLDQELDSLPKNDKFPEVN